MGFLSGREKAPESKKIIIAPNLFSHTDLSKGDIKYIEKHFPKKKLSSGDDVNIKDIEGGFEVLEIEPEPSIPTENTEIGLRNHQIYDKENDELTVPEDQLIELDKRPDVEDKRSVSNAEDFAKLVDQSRGIVNYYPADQLYVTGDYYLELD